MLKAFSSALLPKNTLLITFSSILFLEVRQPPNQIVGGSEQEKGEVLNIKHSLNIGGRIQ